MPLTTQQHEVIAGILRAEDPVELVLIEHPLILDSIALARSLEPVTSGGITYAPAVMSVTPPDQSEQQAPRAALRIEGIDSGVARAIEQIDGGVGATITIRLVLRSDPASVIRTAILSIYSASLDGNAVNLTLGYDDILNRPAVAAVYSQLNTPGLF